MRTISFRQQSLKKKAGQLFVNPLPSGFLEGSVYKEMLYRGSDRAREKGEPLREDGGIESGIYLSTSRVYASLYGKYIYNVFVNIKSPFFVENKGEISPDNISKKDILNLKKDGYDSIIVTKDGNNTLSSDKIDEIVVFDAKNTHIYSIRD